MYHAFVETLVYDTDAAIYITDTVIWGNKTLLTENCCAF
jgi:hypothetical protein